MTKMSRLVFCKTLSKCWKSKICLSTTQASLYHCKSLGPMTAHHNQLPHQPVPPLGTTLEKYLKAVRPLVTEDEFKHTQKLVEEFGAPNGLGYKLHAVLQERYKKLDNWMGNWWLEMDFLEFRDPITVYSNPGGYWTIKDFENIDDQLKYSAKLIVALLDYKKHIDEHKISPDMLKNEPLDMNQYFRILSTCRIPKRKCDQLVLYGQQENPPKHIVVVRNNQFFQLEVYDSDGNPYSESAIFHNLKLLLSESNDNEPPVGILTTEKRDTWADAYERLLRDGLNKQSVDVIQRAIFLVCLDKKPRDMKTTDPVAQNLHNLIHGCGVQYNSGNRWFDKCLQLIVNENGVIGQNMEHSPAEGYSLVKMVEHVEDYIEKKKDIDWSFTNYPTTVKKLNFNLSAETLKDIEEASLHLDQLANDVEIACLVFENFGKDFIKSQRLSPDSFIQMALQLAHYRLHGLRGVLYEVATLHRFLHGRMEIVHSTSIEAVDFCKTMLDKNATIREKAATLRTAVAAHKAAVHEAHRGEGLDAALLGLKRAAKELGLEVPKLFRDYSFQMCYYYRLVTSQLPMKITTMMGSYGPLIVDGYGCPYHLYPDKIHFVSLSMLHRPETTSANLLQAVDLSLKEMQEVVEKSGDLSLTYEY